MEKRTHTIAHRAHSSQLAFATETQINILIFFMAFFAVAAVAACRWL